MPLAVGGAKSGNAEKNSTSGGPGGGGRTTFRPPWVKGDNETPLLKPTVKTSVPWSKKTAAVEKENGEKPSTTTPKTTSSKPATTKTTTATITPTTGTAAKKAAAETSTTAAKKTNPVVTSAKPVLPSSTAKAATTNINPLAIPQQKDTRLQSREIKVPITTDRPKVFLEPLKPRPVVAAAAAAAITKKPSTPSSSSEETTEEETDDEDEEEEEEEETEEETDSEEQKVEEVAKVADNELQRRFAAEKPKLRPVVVKRDKSLTALKKRTDADDDNDDDGGDGDVDAVEGETEEERDRRRRFKLDRPKLRHVVVNKEKPKPNKSIDNFDKIRPVLKKVPKVDELLKEPKEEPKPEFKNKVLKKVPSIKREPSKPNVPAPPPLPSMVPKVPPPPPAPLGPPSDFEKKDISEKHRMVLEKLKTRPRRRPDWSEMMKEVESGRKLRHVECNDRSQPIITCKSMTKVDDKFVYETEKDNSHNKLLKQIQGGVRLKPTQTNDRSKPILEGLRKFRRQMTIEEQIQKSQSKANLANVNEEQQDADVVIDDPSGDELDDIDKIRDDLQSTKQMLALELRNREAQDRENKRLLGKIAALEAELNREKSRETNLEYGMNTIIATNQTTPASDEAFVNTLKKDADDARKTNKELEKKYQDTAEQLDTAKGEIDEQKRMILQLERKLSQALQGGGSLNGSRRPSEANPNKESSPELELSESEEDEDEEKKAARKERRLCREIKLLHNKLNKLKNKQEAAKKEREALKQAMKKNHVILKEENKKFKKLEKEVQKMAASMKEDDEDDENEDSDAEKDTEEEEQLDEEESDEESEEESESESEESGSETESESEPEDATNTAKKTNLEPRVKKHENRLSAMKKCNVLLQANVDNLQDEISKVRTKAASLQSELDAVIADLGL